MGSEMQKYWNNTFFRYVENDKDERRLLIGLLRVLFQSNGRIKTWAETRSRILMPNMENRIACRDYLEIQIIHFDVQLVCPNYLDVKSASRYLRDFNVW